MKIKRFTRRPTTPGEILKEEYLIPLGLTQKIVADHLGIDIKVINRLVNGKTSVSSELALKLASAFDTSPEFWLNAQLAVDLFDAQNELKDSELPGKLNRPDKLRMKLLLFFILFIPKAYSVECQWWQSKVSASEIDKHPRQQTTVRQHPRAEHCRNRWKDADVHIRQFYDDPIIGWTHKGEIFKKWDRSEMQLLLEILPTLPSWAEVKNYNFRRAKDSMYKVNPASSELTNGSIIIYDQFLRKRIRNHSLSTSHPITCIKKLFPRIL